MDCFGLKLPVLLLPFKHGSSLVWLSRPLPVLVEPFRTAGSSELLLWILISSLEDNTVTMVIL